MEPTTWKVFRFKKKYKYEGHGTESEKLIIFDYRIAIKKTQN